MFAIFVFFVFIVFPSLVLALTTFRFHSRHKSTSPGKTPATLPYCVPGIFHSVGLIKSAPAFFAKSVIQYAKYNPFIIKAGPKSFLIIRDHTHIKRVFSTSKIFTRNIFHVFVFEAIMGIPKGTLDPLINPNSPRKDEKQHIENAHTVFPRKYLSGPYLHSLSDVFTASLKRTVLERLRPEGWTQIDDLYSFFQDVAMVASTESLFGTELLKQYPGFVADYWAFDNNAEDFVRGLPRFLAPKTHATRDRLHAGISHWLQTTHRGQDFARLGDEHDSWDSTMGSKFCQASDSTLANLSSFNLKARAAEVLSFVLAANSNTTPYLFWSTLQVLLDPTLRNRLTTLISPHHDRETSTFDIPAINKIPLIQSVQAEIGRLRIGTVVARTTSEDAPLDRNWTVPKLQSITVFNQDVSQNTEIWGKVRPEALGRPLSEFWAERFLAGGDSKKSSTGTVNSSSAAGSDTEDEIEMYGVKDEKEADSQTERFSTKGLGSILLYFGGGQNLCSGRFLVKAMQASVLALLLSEFEIELCDVEATRRSLPPTMGLAYGPIKPSDKVGVRMRRREEVV